MSDTPSPVRAPVVNLQNDLEKNVLELSNERDRSARELAETFAKYAAWAGSQAMPTLPVIPALGRFFGREITNKARDDVPDGVKQPGRALRSRAKPPAGRKAGRREGTGRGKQTEFVDLTDDFEYDKEAEGVQNQRPSAGHERSPLFTTAPSSPRVASTRAYTALGSAVDSQSLFGKLNDVTDGCSADESAEADLASGLEEDAEPSPARAVRVTRSRAKAEPRLELSIGKKTKSRAKRGKAGNAARAVSPKTTQQAEAKASRRTRKGRMQVPSETEQPRLESDCGDEGVGREESDANAEPTPLSDDMPEHSSSPVGDSEGSASKTRAGNKRAPMPTSESDDTPIVRRRRIRKNGKQNAEDEGEVGAGLAESQVTPEDGPSAGSAKSLTTKACRGRASDEKDESGAARDAETGAEVQDEKKPVDTQPERALRSRKRPRLGEDADTADASSMVPWAESKALVSGVSYLVTEDMLEQAVEEVQRSLASAAPPADISFAVTDEMLKQSIFEVQRSLFRSGIQSKGEGVNQEEWNEAVEKLMASVEAEEVAEALQSEDAHVEDSNTEDSTVGAVSAQDSQNASKGTRRGGGAMRKRFKVNAQGKLSTGGLEKLSSMVNPGQQAEPNAENASQTQEAKETAIPSHRSCRLYRANDDVYSTARKPTVPRPRGAQASVLRSAKPGFVAKTPGVRAPLDTLQMHARLLTREVSLPDAQPSVAKNLSVLMTESSTEPSNGSKGDATLAPVTDKSSAEDGEKQRTGTVAEGTQDERRGSGTSSLGKRHEQEPPVVGSLEKKARLEASTDVRPAPATERVKKTVTHAPLAEPKTATSTRIRRPRIVTTKSALRSRIESRIVPNASDTPSDRSNLGAGEASIGASSGRMTTLSGGSGTEHGLSGMSILSMTKARIVPGSSVSPLEPNDSAAATPGPQKSKAGHRSVSFKAPSIGGDDSPANADRPPRDSPADEGADASSTQLGNLMTSISSFLPSFKPKRDTESGETAAEKAAAAQELAAAAATRRTAEIQKKRDEAKLHKQREMEDRQRKIEARRELMAQAQRNRDEERRRKEAERLRKLEDAEAARRRVKEDEERRKQEKRRRVEEQQRRLAVQDDERRAALALKEQAQRERLRKAKGAAGASAARAFTSPARAPAPVRAKPKRSPAPESYEMSARKESAGESSDSELERSRRKKRIPGWARGANLPASLVNETRDPESIFDKVQTINLEEVFKGQPAKRRYRARASSANWTHDRLTAKEEVEYKKMTSGFDANMPPPPPPPAP